MKKSVRQAPSPVAKPTDEPRPQNIAIQHLERARERVRQALLQVKPIGTKAIKDADLADRLLQDLIGSLHGEPPKVSPNEVPENLRRPAITLYDSVILESLKAAILEAEQKGSRSKAKAELVRYIDWVLQTKVGAPLEREAGILGRKVYLLISRGMTLGQIAPRACKQQHSHTKKCADRLRRTAQRYAKQADLPWPPLNQSTKVKSD